MGYNRLMGEQGEQIAADYLIAHGYEIVMCNYRIKGGEIDIIAAKGGTMAFVEVKTRQNLRYGYAIEAVDYKKQARVKRAAELYTQLKRVSCFCRYDVIEVYLTTPATVRHWENAFE